VNDTDHIVQQLHDTLDQHDGLADLLTQSLVQAHKRAEADLNPDLFAALPWPVTLTEYDDYLTGFIRWIPRQSDAQA